MTEKEKLLAGMLYDANYDEALALERMHCKTLCHEFNLLLPSEKNKQDALIKKILGCVKGSFVITGPFYCDYGYNITIGQNFYTNHNCIILDAAKVTFGDDVFIGPNCGFYTAGHPLDTAKRNQGLEYAYPITVGNSVWIGAGVSIMPGVSIGDNVVIGAGSIVTKSIASNSVAYGNPCLIHKNLD